LKFRNFIVERIAQAQGAAYGHICSRIPPKKKKTSKKIKKLGGRKLTGGHKFKSPYSLPLCEHIKKKKKTHLKIPVSRFSNHSKELRQYLRRGLKKEVNDSVVDLINVRKKVKIFYVKK
jgi:hypothetical protein